MHDAAWIKKCVYWQGEDGRFNIISPSQWFHGGLIYWNPRNLVENCTIDKKIMDQALNNMDKPNYYDVEIKMKREKGDKISTSYGGQEAVVIIKSRTEAIYPEHMCSIRNYALKNEEPFAQLNSLRNLLLKVTTPFGYYKGDTCTVPWEIYKIWNPVTKEEFNSLFTYHNKPYGVIWEGYSIAALISLAEETDISNYFNLFAPEHVLPFVLQGVKIASKGKDFATNQFIDNHLYPNLLKKSKFPKVVTHMLKIHRVEAQLEQLKKDLYKLY